MMNLSKKLEKIIKQKKGKFAIDDWITSMQAFGIPADKIAEVVKQPIPQSLYYEIALRQEKTAKKEETILYNTYHLQETDQIVYKDHHIMNFDATVVEVFKNVKQNNVANIVILD